MGQQSNDNQGKRPKVKFEPVPRQESPAQPPAPVEPPARKPPPSEPLALRVLEPGEPPRYGGLRRDERGVVVGAHGLVLVQGQHRLSALLSAFSQVFDLSAGVQLDAPHGESHLLALTPPDPAAAPSLFYETVRGAMVAARLSPRRTLLCVGDGGVFVPFAHPAAPHGYDIAGNAAQQERVVVLPQGARHLPPPQPVPLLDALRSVPLERAGQPYAVTTLALLTDRRLAALVARYVQNHGLAYSARFLSWQQGDCPRQVALFDIVHAREERPVPPFVVNFLGRLPHTTLLTDALDRADLESEPPCRVLVAWGQRTPLYLPHIERLLPTGGALILAGAGRGSALVHPLPPRQQMQHLTCVEAPAPARVAASECAAGRLCLPLTLVRDGAARGPVHGLLLDEAALHRLRRLVRRLPAPWFAHARIVLGKGVALVIAPDAPRGIERIPVGQPLARSDLPGLLLPRGLTLRPTLPPDLLTPALTLQADTLTVLTPTCRYDAPLETFAPVHNLLALDMPAQPLTIRVQPTPLPALDLSDLHDAPPPPPPAPPAPPRPAETENEEKPAGGLKGLVQGIMGQQSRAAPGDLREQAAQLQQAGNYMVAAVLYDHLGERARALACYQQAMEQAQ